VVVVVRLVLTATASLLLLLAQAPQVLVLAVLAVLAMAGLGAGSMKTVAAALNGKLLVLAAVPAHAALKQRAAQVEPTAAEAVSTILRATTALEGLADKVS